MVNVKHLSIQELVALKLATEQKLSSYECPVESYIQKQILIVQEINNELANR